MKDILDWNHISNLLTAKEVDELRSYYKTYHRKHYMYKRAARRYKRIKYAGHFVIGLTATGGIAAEILGPQTHLILIAGGAMVMKTIMSYYNVNDNLSHCRYAFKEYQSLLNEIVLALRSGVFDSDVLNLKMTILNNTINYLCPPVERWGKKYDKKFSGDTN